MACCKRGCAPATLTFTLFVMIASLYLSSNYTTLMWRVTAHHQGDMQTLEMSGEDVEKHMPVVKKRPNSK